MTEEQESARRLMRTLVKVRDSYLDMHTAMGNRLGLKADGKPQKIPEAMRKLREMAPRDKAIVETLHYQIENELKAIEEKLKERVEMFPVYTEWLKPCVPGVGVALSAVILSTIDIERATTVSKIWQFAGLNPGMIRGCKQVLKSKYKPVMGEFVREAPGKDGKEYVVYRTDEYVRGDKLTEGFVAPFNQWLRKKLVGVMGGNFIKQNPYYKELYVNERMRLIQTDMAQTGKPESKYFKLEEGKIKWVAGFGHMSNKARRKMVKLFLIDLYTNWRTLEGLPVRKPYGEDYLGHTHAA